MVEEMSRAKIESPDCKYGEKDMGKQGRRSQADTTEERHRKE